MTVRVPRRAWSEPPLFPQPAAPVLFYKTPAEQWVARKHWNRVDVLAPALTSNHGRLTNVFHHRAGTGSVFGPFFDKNRPFASLSSVKPRNPYTSDATLSGAAFLHVFNGTRDGTRRSDQPRLSGVWAYSGSVTDALGKTAEADFLEPLEPFLEVGDPRRSSVNLWIGQPGATTPCHYDSYHNMYVQLSGSKRFTLYPPSAHGRLKTFPFLHPSFAQCQLSAPLPLEQESRDQASSAHHPTRAGGIAGSGFGVELSGNFKGWLAAVSHGLFSPTSQAPDDSVSVSGQEREERLVGWVAELEPGDVLYIPPAWLHTAEACSVPGEEDLERHDHDEINADLGWQSARASGSSADGASEEDDGKLETEKTRRRRNKKRRKRPPMGAASVSVNVWTGDFLTDQAMESLLSLALPPPLSSALPPPPPPPQKQQHQQHQHQQDVPSESGGDDPRATATISSPLVAAASSGHASTTAQQKAQEQQRKRALSGAHLVWTVLSRYFSACAALSRAIGGGGTPRDLTHLDPVTTEEAEKFASQFLERLFSERYHDLVQSGELKGRRELARHGLFDTPPREKDTNNHGEESGAVSAWAMGWVGMCDDDPTAESTTPGVPSRSQNRLLSSASPPTSALSRAVLADSDMYAQRAVKLLLDLVKAFAGVTAPPQPPSSGKNRLSTHVADAMAAVEHWVRNWVEVVALAAVPLEAVPLFLATLSDCALLSMKE